MKNILEGDINGTSCKGIKRDFQNKSSNTSDNKEIFENIILNMSNSQYYDVECDKSITNEIKPSDIIQNCSPIREASGWKPLNSDVKDVANIVSLESFDI